MSKKLTQEEFEDKLKKVHNGKIICLDKYINNSTKIRFKHIVCNHEWTATPSNVLNGTSCPECAYKIRKQKCVKTHEQFLEDVRKIHDNSIEVLEKYINALTPISFKCNTCGHIWKSKPNDILNGHGCLQCAIKNSRLSQEDFLKKVKEIHGDKLECCGKYKNNHTKIDFKCNDCGYTWKAIPHGILSGGSCPECIRINKTKTHEQFVKQLKELYDDEIICKENYINAKTKILFKHTVCGNKWKARPADILSGYLCPYCAAPKGEKSLQEILEKYNINFKTQYKIAECRNIHPLPFDFAIFDKDDNPVFLLEYDGQQHFKSISIWGGEKRFEEQKLRDQIKNDYCKTNNIPLERIAYNDWKTKDDLENIIVQLLEKHNLIHTNIKGVNHV